MFAWLKSFFSKSLQVIGAIITSVFDTAFKMAMARLKDVATDSIVKLASSDLSNDDKRKQVFQDIKAAAIERVVSVNDSDINLMIETFYKNLKKTGVIS